MKKIFAALVALSFALPCAATPPKNMQRPIDDPEMPDPPAATKPRGTTVLVPPVISVDSTAPAQPQRIFRLPAEAGNVSKVIPTSLLANRKSWIAKGHKYYSLCAPEGRLVACAPLVATSTMKDIEVGAYDDKGEPKITFRIAPGTTQDAKCLIATMNYFLYRTSKQAEHFERKAANRISNSAPSKAGAPTGQNVPTVIDTGDDSGGCSYDEFGQTDCSGGDSGSDGGGHADDNYDWGNDFIGSEDSWNDPATGSLPTFPSGSDSGNGDPCMDANGTNVCQQVVVTGDRPEPMALPVCTITPWVISCTRPPPPVLDPADELPRSPRPWLPQGACNTWNVLCSAGQTPAAEDPPPLTEQDRVERARKQCYDRANATMTMCRALQLIDPFFNFNTCMRNAIDESRECGLIGMDR